MCWPAVPSAGRPAEEDAITDASGSTLPPDLARRLQRIVGERQIADRVIEGKQASLYVDDFHAVYDLADVLTSMGVNAEADEGDY